MPVISTAIGIGSAIYSGGKALGWWGQPKKQRYIKSPEEKAYDALLKTRAETGYYSKATQFNMLNRASRQISNVAQSERLASRGASLFAGTRGVSSREREKVGQENLYRSLVEGSLDISNLNELSKIQAQDVLGQRATGESERANRLRMQSEQARYGARQAGFGQLLSSLGSIFTSPELVKTVSGVMGKDPGLLSPAEIGILRASRLQASNPAVWEGMMMQYDSKNVLGMY